MIISQGMIDEWYVYGAPPIFPPKTRDHDVQIPGKHGEYGFKPDYDSRTFTLRLVLPYTDDKEASRHDLFAMFPLTETDLVYEGKHYFVVLDGQIDPTDLPYGFDCQIPLRMTDPFAYSDEHSQAGGYIVNQGNAPSYPVIEINGAASYPSVFFGSDLLVYSGTVGSGDTVYIDCKNRTVKYNTSNALKDYSGGFPSIVGGVSITSTDDILVKWRDVFI